METLVSLHHLRTRGFAAVRRNQTGWLVLLAGTLVVTPLSIWAQDTELPYKNPHLPVETRVKDLLGRMTLAEKARQLDMYSGADFLDTNQKDNLKHAKPGAVFAPQRGKQTLGNLGVGAIHDLYPGPKFYNSLQAWIIKSNPLGIPALFFEEGLHGYMAKGQTIFPQSVNLGSTWNPKLAREEGAAIAAEARADGVDMILSPVLNVARDPRWGRVEECFGEDPFLCGRMGLAFVQGLQGCSLDTDHTVVSELKHFAAYGSPESGLNTSPVHMGEREIRTIMLKSFEPAIREGHAMSIMAAYNSIDGVPCTGNRWLLTKVLRDEWGFKGFVISDLGAINRLWDVFHVAASPQAAVCLAINSGVDMQFYDFHHDTYENAIINGVKEGKISPFVLNRAVASVLRVKFMLGLFDHPFVNPNLDQHVRRSPQHLALSLEVARQSMCLLKNQNALLPLKKDIHCIAVIGPNTKVTQLGDYSVKKHTSSQEGMLNQIQKLVSPQTRVLYTGGTNIDQAVAMARKAQVVIMGLGERVGICGEWYDRSELGLPGNQETLLEAVVKTGVPVVLVLENGRALAIPWAAKHVPAILEAWYPGEFGGKAIAETLFGENNPVGRLPVSFPRSVGQLPVYYDHAPSKGNKYVGGDDSPLFVFGYGLSYTTYKYSHLTVTPPPVGSTGDVLVTFELTNTGKRAGDEVAQVYVREETASVETPVEALKGFQRVHLEPGQTKRVTLHLKQSDLAVWGIDRKWEVEPGTFKVMVGGSSAGGLSARFALK